MNTSIYQIESFSTLQHEIDPARGSVAKRVEHIRAGTIEKIVHEGKEYVRDERGNFTLPEEHALHFVGDGRRRPGLPGWHRGHNPFQPEKPAAAKR